jgi:putative hemolysin
VLNLLWKGIGSYARQEGARYLIGCSSLTSQSPAEGAAAWQRLMAHEAPESWRTRPREALACPLDAVAAEAPRVPRLLSAYLALGARLCGPPAIDRAFRTIDFLTWLDVESPGVVAMQARGRFVAPIAS